MADRPVVLIADDNDDVVLLLKTYLRPIECDFLGARDGEEALRVAQEHLPDVVLLDVMMPRRSGWEVCQALKSIQRTSGIAVVLVTGRGDVKDRLTGLQVGADDYLVKPFNREEVLKRVRALLGRSARELKPSSPPKADDGSLDRVTGLPILSMVERTLPLPNSIAESVLHGEEAEAAPAGVKPATAAE